VSGVEVVRRYFDSMMAHDWPAVRSCLSDDFTRVGPYPEHVWDGPDDYLAFLVGLLPGLRGHSVAVTQVTGDDAVVHAEATERVELEGIPSTVRVSAAFDLADDGRIRHVEVFVRRPQVR
jgi:ketosteroid isomerase-like protein